MTVVRPLLLIFLFQLSFSDFAFPLSETEALLQLKKSFTNADRLNNWVPNSDPCKEKWTGAICFAGRIEGLHLSDLGLSGKIDVNSLLELKGLRTMSFVNNRFSGPIPEFNKLGALKSLLLPKNNFSGEIPADFFATMSSLKKVWISDNEFTGKIPESVTQLPNLIELHLERDQFSGKIPPLKQPKRITSMSLAKNNLEGEIPPEFSSFNASSFEGNPKLCGKPLNKACSNNPEIAFPSPTNTSPTMIGIMMLTFISAFIAFKVYSGNGRKSGEKLNAVERDNSGGKGLPVRVQDAGEGSRNLKQGDLVVVNEERGSFGMQDLMRAAAEVLGSGGIGSAYKAEMTTGVAVVVKRMREMNMMGRDLFDAEMRRFGRIKHKNVLSPLAFHFRKEEKLLVSEYVPKGSLFRVLHGDRGIFHAELNWPTRLKIIKGVAEGLSHLHKEFSSYKLPHGNLKSSNVLLGQTYEPLLVDYALDPLINTTYSPQALFAYKSPEYTNRHEISPKSDIYCLGIIIIEIMTGKVPSQCTNGKGGTDVVQWATQTISQGREEELIDPEISDKCSRDTIRKMVEMLRIGIACAEFDTSKRLDLKEAIRRIQEIN